MQNHSINTILVPQGAEYKSVCRGLKRSTAPTPLVIPVPVGVAPLTRYLERLQQAGDLSNHPQPRVLLMGLCGSLTPRYNIGDIVLYDSCIYSSNDSTEVVQNCDPELTALIHHVLKERVNRVKALTSDRIIYSAKEKLHLGQQYKADVVDMEGFAALEILSQAGVAVAMLRVISDNCHHNIPNLTWAISADGSLQAVPLAIAMLQQPIAASRLILGAMRGLQVLQETTTFITRE
ncbi:MAG TPA: phosphorylase [Cyanobacteria bacterium UBA8553]|nr:phosphorylase [Cyanobacteria bacterium UBA8553]HAJ64677.1 phosphorylase [Cyanobacteria bacterium UBA8543]